MRERDVAVLVLAGGDGRRLGGAKPQRRIGGRSLYARVAAFAHTQGAPIAAAVRHPAQVESADGVELVLDAEGLSGPLAGLSAGLNWASGRQAPYLLTLPCDAPFLPPDLALRLRARLESSRGAAAIPECLSRLHTACGLWRTDCRHRLAAYASGGRASLRGFAEFVGYDTVNWTGAAVDPFFNINTPQDLEAASLLQPHLE